MCLPLSLLYHHNPAPGQFQDSSDPMRGKKKRASADQLAGEHKALHASCHGNIQQHERVPTKKGYEACSELHGSRFDQAQRLKLTQLPNLISTGLPTPSSNGTLGRSDVRAADDRSVPGMDSVHVPPTVCPMLWPQPRQQSTAATPLVGLWPATPKYAPAPFRWHGSAAGSLGAGQPAPLP